LKTPQDDPADAHIHRVRRLCTSLHEVTEKLSHGAPTFFARKRVFAMVVNNHHNDGHVAVWIPAAPGVQAALIKSDPRVYYRPPYVGPSGWVGIELDQMGDEDLAIHLREAYDLILAKQKKPGLIRKRSAR
jgi:hypothetical protein